MAALQALYMQDPYWIWLALSCLFLSLKLATGSGLLMWPGAAAVVVALLELAGLRLGPILEAIVFAVLTLAALAVVIGRRLRDASLPAIVPLPSAPSHSALNQSVPRQYASSRPKQAAAAPPTPPKTAGPKTAPAAAPAGAASVRQEQNARLTGRIGRSTGEFVNGVGRVWIDGAEWGAELDGGDESLPKGSPVRVVKVIGGIKLQVHALQSG
jgi:membrane protein implicated in regulation of membrane protease activity